MLPLKINCFPMPLPSFSGTTMMPKPKKGKKKAGYSAAYNSLEIIVEMLCDKS